MPGLRPLNFCMSISSYKKRLGREYRLTRTGDASQVQPKASFLALHLPQAEAKRFSDTGPATRKALIDYYVEFTNSDHSRDAEK